MHWRITVLILSIKIGTLFSQKLNCSTIPKSCHPMQRCFSSCRSSANRHLKIIRQMSIIPKIEKYFGNFQHIDYHIEATDGH